MKIKLRILISIFLVAGLVVGLVLQQNVDAVVPGVNQLVTYNATNTAPSVNGGTVRAHVSEDGNIVAWTSSSHDVITGDTSQWSTLYVRNLQTGATSFANLDVLGAPAALNIQDFAMSRTGRFIAFSTSNTNMVTSPVIAPVGGGPYPHVYLRDTLLGVTKLVDQSASGAVANIGRGSGTAHPYAINVSDDGRFVTFISVATNLLATNNPVSPNYDMHLYVKDMLTGQIINPTTSNAGLRANASTLGGVDTSCDGSLLIFNSASTNLTPQDNGNNNVYIVDLRNGYNIANITHASNNGASAISISCSGRYVVMASKSTNLTTDTVSGVNSHIFRFDRLTNKYALIDKSSSGYISSAQSASGLSGTVSDDGKVVFFGQDPALVTPAALNSFEIYVRDPEAGTTELVPVDSSGIERGLGSNTLEMFKTLQLSSNGKAVIYKSYATNLIPGIGAGSEYKLVLSKID